MQTTTHDATTRLETPAPALTARERCRREARPSWDVSIATDEWIRLMALVATPNA